MQCDAGEQGGVRVRRATVGVRFETVPFQRAGLAVDQRLGRAVGEQVVAAGLCDTTWPGLQRPRNLGKHIGQHRQRPLAREHLVS